MKLKDHARSRQELELAVKLDPNDAKAHYNLAVLYARLKETKLAEEHMQIVEKLKSKGIRNENDLIAPSSLTQR
jgi:Tfp pilus assembly protein PilF